jgi:RNA polymerase sigma-70 factor (ECF subfamily)
VLHDVFQLPFDEIAPMVDRTPAATRQLASRARRRLQGANLHEQEPDISRQRQVVDAFFAAARGGDFHALVTLLHPDVVLRSDFGGRRSVPPVIRGPAAVAGQSLLGAAISGTRLHPVLVNGSAGVIVTRRGRPFTIMAGVGVRLL